MKRINTVFTAVHILAAITMLIQIAYEVSRPQFSVSPNEVVYVGLLYLLLFIIINGTWILIRRARGEKRSHDPEQTVSDDSARLRFNRLTVIFISLNILLSVAAIIHAIIGTLHEGGSFPANLLGCILIYSIPAVIINDVWVVVYMNMKDRLEEKGQK